MSAIEGKGKSTIDALFNATWHEVVTATDNWVEYEFKDYEGNPFDSLHIAVKETGGKGFLVSFDPRPADHPDKKTHGTFSGNEDFLFRNKRATSIWVKRAGADNATVRITAWR